MTCAYKAGPRKVPCISPSSIRLALGGLNTETIARLLYRTSVTYQPPTTLEQFDREWLGGLRPPPGSLFLRDMTNITRRQLSTQAQLNPQCSTTSKHDRNARRKQALTPVRESTRLQKSQLLQEQVSQLPSPSSATPSQEVHPRVRHLPFPSLTQISATIPSIPRSPTLKSTSEAKAPAGAKRRAKS